MSGTCSECGATLPEEIDPDTGVYCTECGTGQMVTDGGESTVKACRACDSSELYRRRPLSSQSPFGPDDPEWKCTDCGHEMHSPKRRKKRYAGDTAGRVQRLLDGGKDIVTDGGRVSSNIHNDLPEFRISVAEVPVRDDDGEGFTTAWVAELPDGESQSCLGATPAEAVDVLMSSLDSQTDGRLTGDSIGEAREVLENTLEDWNHLAEDERHGALVVALRHIEDSGGDDE